MSRDALLPCFVCGTTQRLGQMANVPWSLQLDTV